MSAFEIARSFFEACEQPLGWAGCASYCTADATFDAQSEPVAELTTLREYCDWMHGFGTAIAPGCSYTLHHSAWDAETRTGLFFATFYGTHSGDGGPVPPTGQATQSHYVYAITVNDKDQVSHMTKIWNAPWAMRELGWA